MNAMQLRDVTNIGYWNGLGGNSWDNDTTANFCTNVYTVPLRQRNLFRRRGLFPTSTSATITTTVREPSPSRRTP